MHPGISSAKQANQEASDRNQQGDRGDNGSYRHNTGKNTYTTHRRREKEIKAQNKGQRPERRQKEANTREHHQARPATALSLLFEFLLIPLVISTPLLLIGQPTSSVQGILEVLLQPVGE